MTTKEEKAARRQARREEKARLRGALPGEGGRWLRDDAGELRRDSGEATEGSAPRRARGGKES